VSDAYKELIPLFQAQWLAKTGQKVTFQQSYAGSGAQSRAVIGGLEADVVALSLETDVTKIAKAKLITHDWQAGDYHGFVTDSVVVLAVRKDNPKNIKDWADLTQAGLGILTPDPSTSGGAQWNILAAFGAARHGKITGYDKSDAGGLKYLGDIFKNVVTLDKDGQTSLLTFEKGIGDVAINYENSVLSSIQAGTAEAIVYLPSTILIENPVAVVDTYVDKHGTRAVAEAFVNFLLTPDAQRVYAKHNFRPVEPTVAKDPAIVKQFPVLPDQFTIAEFGGWSKVSSELFGDKGTITAVLNSVKGQ
jgi:sulfate transport system substrate-binding protein